MKSSRDYIVGAVVGGIVATFLLIEAIYINGIVPVNSNCGILLVGSIISYGLTIFWIWRAWETFD